MIEFIYKNYGIIINKIYNDYFFISDSKIVINKINDKNLKHLKILNDISNYYYHNGINVSTFIYTKNNELYAKYNDENIVLLKVNDINDKIRFENLIFFDVDFSLEKYDLVNEYKLIIDSIENRITELNNEYPLIQKSINFFIGLAENSIEVLNNFEIRKVNICHKLEFNNYNLLELYNPFNYIKTTPMYDISNYFKYTLLHDNLNYDDLLNVISLNDEEENLCLFACLLFPNLYFDVVNKVVDEIVSENMIELFINHVDSYIDLLKFYKKSIKNSKILNDFLWI